MSRFTHCLEIVLGEEGGYVDHKADRGGKTSSSKYKSKANYFGKVCGKHPELNGERFYAGNCVACAREKTAKWREENAERAKKAQSEWREKHRDELRAKVAAQNRANPYPNREKAAAWYAANKDKPEVMAARKAYAKKYVAENTEKLREKSAKWNAANKELKRAYAANRRAYRRQRTPGWADIDAIKKFYVGCPDGYHVDHIIPMRGKLVSGLHVLSNLQYLPAVENLKKGASFDVGECANQLAYGEAA